MVLPDLLDGSPLANVDPDAVASASGRVRDFCDWHIAPSVTETVTVTVKDGVALLPSLFVTGVASVDGAAAGFSWSRDGRVVLNAWRRHGTAVVVFTHGYEVCPPSVKAVVAQIAAAGLVPGPQRRSQTAGPYAEAYFEPADPLNGIYAYRRLTVA